MITSQVNLLLLWQVFFIEDPQIRGRLLGRDLTKSYLKYTPRKISLRYFSPEKLALF